MKKISNFVRKAEDQISVTSNQKQPDQMQSVFKSESHTL